MLVKTPYVFTDEDANWRVKTRVNGRGYKVNKGDWTFQLICFIKTIPYAKDKVNFNVQKLSNVILRPIERFRYSSKGSWSVSRSPVPWVRRLSKSEARPECGGVQKTPLRSGETKIRRPTRKHSFHWATCSPRMRPAQPAVFRRFCWKQNNISDELTRLSLNFVIRVQRHQIPVLSPNSPGL
jgi:hypothetical protein